MHKTPRPTRTSTRDWFEIAAFVASIISTAVTICVMLGYRIEFNRPGRPPIWFHREDVGFELYLGKDAAIRDIHDELNSRSPLKAIQ